MSIARLKRVHATIKRKRGPLPNVNPTRIRRGVGPTRGDYVFANDDARKASLIRHPWFRKLLLSQQEQPSP